MSLSNPTVADLLLLDLPILIEMLLEETSNHAHLLSTEGLGIDTTEARVRVLNLQTAIEIKRASANQPVQPPPAVGGDEGRDLAATS